MQNVFFNLEDKWVKKAKHYIAFYNFKHVEEKPLSFSALIREALREYTKDGLNISDILENNKLQSSYRVCRVRLTEEDAKELERAKLLFRNKGLNISSGALIRASLKSFLEKRTCHLYKDLKASNFLKLNLMKC
ncbi:MAG: hypothetical protein RXS42_05650 [Nitrososphaeria archaeon]